MNPTNQHTPSFSTEQRQVLAHDPHRPRYHYLPPANWLNDPNGLIQWQGRYHLFYQYNPNGPFHGTIHWGHAVSDDLVHWQDLPIALAPTPGGPDEEGCYSGCAVDHDGVPTLIYTGVFPQVVCLATSSDEMRTWRKHAGNPVIATPPPGLEHRSGGHFRDPFVWQENGRWHMLIGCKDEGVGGLILLYQSEDLQHWQYLHPFLQGDVNQMEPFWSGTMWECPNYLDFGEKKMLIFSVQANHMDLLYTVYHVGQMRDLQFTPETEGILVHGDSFYAPQVMQLADSRYLMWGWLQEGRSQQSCQEAGWSGVMSLPIVISLAPDGTPSMVPAAELTSLRGAAWHFEGFTVSPESSNMLPDVQGSKLEILVLAEFEPNGAAEIGLRLCCTPDGREQTQIIYQPTQNRVIIERDHSSLSDVVDKKACVAPFTLAPGERLSLHIFLDGSVVEVFVNGRTCLIGRIYPTDPNSLEVGLVVRNGRVKIKSLDIWEMESIWP